MAFLLFASVIGTTANAIIGFKVGGFCVVGCGRDSALNQAAGSIGSAFTDEAIQNFGNEGRRVVDYANRQLSATLDAKISQLDQAITSQRNEFRADLEEIAAGVNGEFRTASTAAIDRLSEELTVQIDSLSQSLSNQLDRVSRIFATLAGIGVACLAVLLFGLYRIFRSKRFSRVHIAGMAATVLIGALSGYAVATISNSRADARHRSALEERFQRALTQNQVILATILARKIDNIDGDPTNDLLSQKMGLVRDIVLSGSSEAYSNRIEDLAALQRLFTRQHGRPDPDIAALQVYLATEVPDSLVTTVVLRDVAAMAGSSQPLPQFALGQLSTDLRRLACEMSGSLNRSGASLEGANAGERWDSAETARGFEAHLGFDWTAHPVARGATACNELTGRPSGRVASAAGPLFAELSRRQIRFQSAATADTIVLRCLLYRLCAYSPAGLGPSWQTLYRRSDSEELFSETPQDDLRHVIALDFVEWYVRRLDLTNAAGLSLESSACLIPRSRIRFGFGPSIRLPCVRPPNAPPEAPRVGFSPADLDAFLAAASPRFNRFMERGVGRLSPHQRRAFARLQTARRRVESERYFNLSRLLQADGAVDAGLADTGLTPPDAARSSAEAINLLASSEYRNNRDYSARGVDVGAFTQHRLILGDRTRNSLGGAIGKDGQAWLGHVRICYSLQGGYIQSCSSGSVGLPLLFLLQREQSTAASNRIGEAFAWVG